MESKQFSYPLPLADVRVNDPFWSEMMEKVRTKVIPYQWEALNDRIEGAEPSYCIRNFQIAADITAKKPGAGQGEFGGCVFQDSDAAKWLEAVAYSLEWHPDPELEKTADGVIDLICSAQQEDGYLDTYYIINGLEKRFTNLKDNHELYCLGHFIEAAVAYSHATGKRKLLDAMIRYVDCVDAHFGLEEGKHKGYPGHQVIEMALIRLYDITKDEKHLKLAKYFIDQRGQSPLYFEQETKKNGNEFYWKDSLFQYQYYQAGKPVRDQHVAEGHAVRAVYLYSGMADVARKTGDEELLKACETLWNNIVNKQMYITGAIGQSAYGEAFTYDYDLPNDTVYAETCAAIALMFFARRMLEISPKGVYADVMERALYNGIISGMSLDGTKFFYVNPLEVVPEASEKDQLRKHVKVERQKWFGCACCPPNVARLLSSIGSYAYTQAEDTFYMHLYLGGEIKGTLNGKNIAIHVESDYPWKEDVQSRMSLEGEMEFAFAIRVPGWCGDSYGITLNGEEASYEIINGYAILKRKWSDGDTVTLHMPMPVKVIQSNPRVRENIGKVAVMRGPLVYCLEEEDNGTGLHLVRLGENPEFKTDYQADFLGGVVVLTSNGQRLENGWEKGPLYREVSDLAAHDTELKWIPYYAWANRNPGEMMVWVYQ